MEFLLNGLIFPEEITLRLEDVSHQPVQVPDVLLGIRIFAMRKNDFFLQPFVTDGDGVAIVKKRDLLAEVAAHYDSGLMDYVEVESSQPTVEIRAITEAEIAKIIHARTHVWKSLLRGEADRWSSIEQLIEVYRRAANAKLSISSLRKDWGVRAAHCNYALVTQIL